MKEERFLELKAAYERLIPPARAAKVARGLYRGQARRANHEFYDENFQNDAEFQEFRKEYRRRQAADHRREARARRWVRIVAFFRGLRLA